VITTMLSLAAADSAPGAADLVAALRDGAVPIFAGAQVIVPIIVLLLGIHKMVDHRTENHAVLLTELFGFIVVIEGVMMALKHFIGL
jgi:hypothetical protein